MAYSRSLSKFYSLGISAVILCVLLYMALGIRIGWGSSKPTDYSTIRSDVHYRITGIDAMPKIHLKVPKSHPLRDAFLREIHKEPATHQLMFALIANTPKKKALIFDAGAHVGDTSLWLAQFAQSMRHPVKIITVDPNQEKVDFIRMMAAMNGLDNLIAVHAGVGDRNSLGEEVKTYKKFHWWFSRPLLSPMYQVKPSESGNIHIRTVDEIIAGADVPEYPLRLLHLDVEGYEYLAIQGADRQIQKNKPLTVIELLQRDGSDQWIRSALAKRGYQSSDAIAHEFKNTIFFAKSDPAQKKLLSQLNLLPQTKS